MTDASGKAQSIVAGGNLPAGVPGLPEPGAAAAIERHAFVEIGAGQRKLAVLLAMPTIRWLLTMHRFQVDTYSDDAIADALLETCPRPDDFWLRAEHLHLAVRRVTAAHPPRPRRT